MMPTARPGEISWPEITMAFFAGTGGGGGGEVGKGMFDGFRSLADLGFFSRRSGGWGSQTAALFTPKLTQGWCHF